MPGAKLHSPINSIIMSWLAEELKKEIPDLDLDGPERSLLDFAYHDLGTCLKLKGQSIKSVKDEEALMDEDRREEIKAFLKVWTKQWLEKWRQRVTFSQQIPHFSLAHLKAKKKAAKIFKGMENGQELKRLVAQKLINQGEVCMTELIAENLIVEDIAYHLKMSNGKMPTDQTLKPWNILQEVSPRIKQLTERRTPIIHLKLMMEG